MSSSILNLAPYGFLNIIMYTFYKSDAMHYFPKLLTHYYLKKVENKIGL